MDNKDWLVFHKECCDKMHEITIRKNHDYTGSSSSPFKNFENVELMGVASTEHGFLVRMMDKMARLTNFVNTNTLLVKDESVTDTLLDLANYSLLMAGYIESKKQRK